MTSRVLTFGAGVFVAGLVGSAMAAVPDPSPFTWPRPVSDWAEVVLPDAPPPPRSLGPQPPLLRATAGL